jgi:6-phosphogluconolactonase (cycloisomerase 2 family)
MMGDSPHKARMKARTAGNFQHPLRLILGSLVRPNSVVWLRAVVALCWVLLASCGGQGDGGGGGSVNPPSPALPHSVGGTVNGVSGTVVLTNNGGDSLAVSTNGSFTFAVPLSDGASYSVGVLSQPTSQQCTVTAATGTMGLVDVTNVVVTCRTVSFTVGGTVSGLSGTVVLQNNGGDDLVVSANGTFVFTTALASGATYQVAVSASPAFQQCVVFSGSGTISSANIDNISVACFTPSFSIGGTVSGLSGTVVLRNNGGDDLTLSQNGSFTFATPVANGASYNVTVASKPTIQECTVSSGSGTVSGAVVLNVSVTCTTPTFTVGGTVFGLVGTVVLRNNGGDDRTVSANGPFSFATPLLNGATYQVSVLTQPATQECAVMSGSGTIASANVADVNVTCTTPTFTVGGTVTGLAGTIVLRNNGGDDLTISADGTFSFTSPVAKGGTYSVTILSKPEAQHCGVKAGSGTISLANVSDIKVTCLTFRVGKYVYVATADASISQYEIGTDGGLIPLTPATVPTGVSSQSIPTSMAVDPFGRYAYVATIDSLVASSISQYAIGPNGTLSPLVPALVSAGLNPIEIAVDSTAKFAYVANFGDGNSISGGSISQYAIGVDGALTPLAPAAVSANGNPSGIGVDPASQRCYVSTALFSDGAVLQYAIGGDGTLSPLVPSQVASDLNLAGGQITVDPFDRYTYLVQGFLGRVRQYMIDANGSLVPLVPSSVFNATNFPGSIAVHPAGTHVYVGAGGTISMFSIAADGTLALMNPSFVDGGMGGTIPVGSIPSIAIDPAGRFLYAPSRTGPVGTVLQYKIEADGKLTAMTPPKVDSGQDPRAAAISP